MIFILQLEAFCLLSIPCIFPSRSPRILESTPCHYSHTTTMKPLMNPDDLSWEQAEVISDNWHLQFLELDTLRPIADFILHYNRGHGTGFAFLKNGSYNITLRLKYREGAVVIRFLQPGAVFFPEEKTENEVAVMRFLTDQTSIPVPFVLHSGMKVEIPLGLSPFI